MSKVKAVKLWSFEKALRAMKAGKRVRRKGWPGLLEEFVFLDQDTKHFRAQTGSPHLDMKQSDIRFTSEDILAQDWYPCGSTKWEKKK